MRFVCISLRAKAMTSRIVSLILSQSCRGGDFLTRARIRSITSLARPPSRTMRSTAARASSRSGDWRASQRTQALALVRNLPDRLLPCPSVQFFGGTIPKGDDVVDVAHEDCIVRKIEKIGSFPQSFFAPLAFRDLGLQRFTSPPEVGGPLLNSCFQLIACLLERLFCPSALNSYPTGDEA